MKPVMVFDLDDTLYPESAFVSGGFRAVGQEIARQYGIPDATSALTQVMKEGFQGQIFNETLRRLGIAYSNAIIEHFVRIYREHSPNISLYSDAACVLTYLNGRIPLAMISDGWESTQRRKLGALGIEDLFSPAVFTFSLGCDWHKPSRLPFDHVTDTLGGSGERYIYVADNPAKDFIGAVAAGWQTVRIVRTDSVHQSSRPAEDAAGKTLYDLRELLSLLNLETKA